MFSKRNLWIAVVVLVAYATFQLMADIGATKMVVFGPWVIPAGTFAFALTFTLRDLIHKQLGFGITVAVVVSSALLNLVTATYLNWVGQMPAPEFYPFDQWGQIFSIVPAIAIGSIGAEITSQLLDTSIYQLVWNLGGPQWLRALSSNLIAAPVDSVVFVFLAFVVLPPLFGAESVPFSVAIPLSFGNMILKWIIGVISTPLIYLVPRRDDRDFSEVESAIAGEV